MKFLHPYFFLLLLLLPLLARWYWQQYKQRHAAVTLPSLQGVAGVETIKAKLRRWLPIFRALGFIALVIALARPQLVLKEEKIKAEGIDIMLSMDLSSSMLAQDFEPNRLAVSKKMAVEFVKGRPHDRIGLVVFAGEAFTQCPLTTDHKIVEGFLEQLECGNLEDGTAIGMGLAGAVNRLKGSKTKSKVIILLTDGVNNVGYFKPLTAGELAKEMGIKVYSIGVGTIGEALTPVSRLSDGSFFLDYAQVEIDEELLREIAKMTGGKYFRAKNNQDLREIYKTIDQLEKTEIQVTRIKKYSEEFHRWVFIGLLFLLAEFVLRQTWLRSLP